MKIHVLPTIKHRFWKWVAYARHKREVARDFPKARGKFQRKHGYAANFESPRSHSERIHVRKLFDRNPLFTVFSDKLAVRGYIEDKLGKARAAELMVPVLATSRRFGALPTGLWEQDVVVKCNHGSRMNYVVPKGDTRARADARRNVRQWLGKVHGWRKAEWAYWDIVPTILVEPRLNDVIDLKLYMYDGKLRFLMPENNEGAHPKFTVYGPDWQPLPYRWPDIEPMITDPPKNLAQMIEIAEILSRDIDMLRVDFLLSKERFYLGELTIYDASGLSKFTEIDHDFEMGAPWRQPHLGFDQNMESPSDHTVRQEA